MNKELGVFVLLLPLFLVTYGQQNDLIERSIEAFIIEKSNYKFVDIIELDKKKEFDLNKIIDEYKIPDMMGGDSGAIRQNERTFERLSNFSETVKVAYYIPMIYGVKDKESDPLTPGWAIVLLDKSNNILDYTNYVP